MPEFLLSSVVEIQSMLEDKLIHSSVLIAARESRQNLRCLPFDIFKIFKISEDNIHSIFFLIWYIREFCIKI